MMVLELHRMRALFSFIHLFINVVVVFLAEKGAIQTHSKKELNAINIATTTDFKNNKKKKNKPLYFYFRR